jgi:hypothetical protein
LPGGRFYMVAVIGGVGCGPRVGIDKLRQCQHQAEQSDAEQYGQQQLRKNVDDLQGLHGALRGWVVGTVAAQCSVTP